MPMSLRSSLCSAMTFTERIAMAEGYRPQTIAARIFLSRTERPACVGESVVDRVDEVIATEGSGPLALEFFRQMGGTSGCTVTASRDCGLSRRMRRASGRGS
jgi:hypothetical protein